MPVYACGHDIDVRTGARSFAMPSLRLRRIEKISATTLFCYWPPSRRFVTILGRYWHTMRVIIMAIVTVAMGVTIGV